MLLTRLVFRKIIKLVEGWFANSVVTHLSAVCCCWVPCLLHEWDIDLCCCLAVELVLVGRAAA
jgi:hypothetical protein